MLHTHNLCFILPLILSSHKNRTLEISRVPGFIHYSSSINEMWLSIYLVVSFAVLLLHIYILSAFSRFPRLFVVSLSSAKQNSLTSKGFTVTIYHLYSRFYRPCTLLFLFNFLAFQTAFLHKLFWLTDYLLQNCYQNTLFLWINNYFHI